MNVTSGRPSGLAADRLGPIVEPERDHPDAVSVDAVRAAQRVGHPLGLRDDERRGRVHPALEDLA